MMAITTSSSMRVKPADRRWLKREEGRRLGAVLLTKREFICLIQLPDRRPGPIHPRRRNLIAPGLLPQLAVLGRGIRRRFASGARQQHLKAASAAILARVSCRQGCALSLEPSPRAAGEERPWQGCSAHVEVLPDTVELLAYFGGDLRGLHLLGDEVVIALREETTGSFEELR